MDSKLKREARTLIWRQSIIQIKLSWIETLIWRLSTKLSKSIQHSSPSRIRTYRENLINSLRLMPLLDAILTEKRKLASFVKRLMLPSTNLLLWLQEVDHQWENILQPELLFMKTSDQATLWVHHQYTIHQLLSWLMDLLCQQLQTLSTIETTHQPTERIMKSKI